MRLLSPLLTALAAEDLRAVADRAKRNILVLALAGLFGFTAYLFLLAALALWLGEALGPAGGAFVVGGGMAALAFGLLGWLAMVRRREQKARRRKLAAGSGRAALLAGVAALAPVALRSKTAWGLAAVAGLAFVLFSRKGGADDEPPADL